MTIFYQQFSPDRNNGSDCAKMGVQISPWQANVPEDRVLEFKTVFGSRFVMVGGP